MSNEQKQEIIEYIFQQQHIPAHIMDELSRWLIEHESDPETETLMFKRWQELSKTIFEEDDLKMLKEVRTSIKDREQKKKYRFSVLKKTAKFVTAILLFAGGGLLSMMLNKPVKEITMVTSNDNIGEFVLPDGTKVWLNEQSSLTYPEHFTSKERHVALNGEGFFEVVKEDRPFKVSMQNLLVEVKGTSFSASCYRCDSKEEVVLRNGSVMVCGENIKSPLILKPDERLVYSPYDGNVNIDTIDVANTYRWYEKYLTFENARFEDILSNIEHRYRINIKMLASVSMDKRLSLTIIHESLETIMDVISTLLPIKYEIHDNSLIIRDKKQ